MSKLTKKAKKHRNSLRARGLRPIQIWVPDTRHPHFAEECRRQSLLASQADKADSDLMSFLDAALSDISELPISDI